MADGYKPVHQKDATTAVAHKLENRIQYRPHIRAHKRRFHVYEGECGERCEMQRGKPAFLAVTGRGKAAERERDIPRCVRDSVRTQGHEKQQLRGAVQVPWTIRHTKKIQLGVG